MSSNVAVMMMVMMAGMVVCCSGGASTIVTLVNEKIIDVGFLDFLLIPGWGKPKTEGTGGTTTGTTTGTHCIDTTISACKSGSSFTTLYTVDNHDACVSKTKDECIAAGGSWTSSVGTYPKDCIAGSRIECVTKRGKDRTTCTNDYRTRCVAAGGSWGGTSSGSTPSGSSPSGSTPSGTTTLAQLCSRFGTSLNAKGTCGPGKTKVNECKKCMDATTYDKYKAEKARIFGS